MFQLKKILNNSISTLFRILIAVVSVFVLISKYISYNEYFKRSHVLGNAILMIFGILFFTVLYGCFERFDFLKSKTKKVVILIVLFVFQVIISLCSMYGTGWDAGTLTEDAYNLAIGNSFEPGYYSSYTNNMLSLVLYAKLFSLATHIGLSSYISAYGFCVVFNCIIYYCVGLLLADCIYKLTGDKKMQAMGFLVCYVFVYISPWNFVLYTDSLGIIFPVLMLWIYLSITENSVKKSIIKWIMMLFVSIVGFHIKAESVIMLIAIVIAHSIHVFVENRGVEIIKKLVPIILVLALVVPSFKLGSYSVIRTFENETGTEYDSEKSFSMFHWLMIGMNVESDGTFNGEDDTFSHYISDSEERESQNKKVIKQRLKEMGPSGFCVLMIHKLILNYNDGSFGNGLDGEGFIVNKFSKDTPANSWIRFFYRPDHKGFSVYLNLVQLLWLGILFFSFFIKNKWKYQSIMLSIIGLSAFVMLFEAQPRYLIVFAPIYVITGILGMSNFFDIANRKGYLVKIKSIVNI